MDNGGELNLDEQVQLIYSNDPTHTETLITNLTSSSNHHRSQAETLLNHLGFHFLPRIAKFLRLSPNPTTRTMCALLLRNLILTHWPQVYAVPRSTICHLLAYSLHMESDPSIARKICDTASDLAAIIILPYSYARSSDLLYWPSFIRFFNSGVALADQRLKQMCLRIFARVPQNVREFLLPDSTSRHDFLAGSLAAPNCFDVRVTAVAAAVNFLQCLPNLSEQDRFEDLLPLMMSTFTDVLVSGHEAAVQDSLKLFIELAENWPRLLEKQVTNMVESMLEVAEDESLEEGTCHLALEFVMTLSETGERAPEVMRKMLQFVQRLLLVAMKLLLDIGGDLVEAEAEGTNNYEYGQECLYRLSVYFGGSAIVPIVSELLPTYLAASEWKKRHAALIALAQIADGCSDEMIKNMDHVLSMVLDSFHDPHARVRWAAVNAIRQWSTDLGPDLQVKYHHLVLPALAGAIDDSQNPRLQAYAASAVSIFAENCIIRHCNL
ncbi:uncharacterized protein LOC130715529 isoform X2 [Lotus japonicus]|uniref:uncharacterized protein LOC130715529 isoform X2 n=1 Tax=Lotus japonicus TaxID=34305 RepID=UPI002582EC59|nr:uncharacterized protein LOC130715529 isoform X2 [Lotus japonicus]